MPRSIRSHLPGAVFHLTARTQGGERWFTEGLRDRIVEYTASSLRASDAQLLAWAVMPNHLHLVIRQGNWTLGRVMQGPLHRVALLVQRAHSLEGHVFERRFEDRVCLDPEYCRNAIVYTHLNPVRAGLVRDPEEYPWTSHRAYAHGEAPPSMLGVLRDYAGLSVFADRPGSGMSELRDGYRQFVAWRMGRDAAAKGRREASPEATPLLLHGTSWSRQLAPLFRPMTGGDARRPDRRGDMAAIAERALAECAPEITVGRLRSGEGSKGVVAARREVVSRLDDAGHRGSAIARYLNVSPQCVSAILVRRRRRC